MLNYSKQLKFTFDIGKILKKSENKKYNYSEIRLCSEYSNVIKQEYIFECLRTNFPQDIQKINHIEKLGLCLLASIYSSFSYIFESFDNFLKYIMDSYTHFSNISKNVEKLNVQYNAELKLDKTDKELSYQKFISNINKNKSVVVTYNWSSNLLNYPPHAISLFGYDDTYIYYHETGDDILFKALAYYLNNYLAFNDINNFEYNKQLLKNIKNAKSEKELFENSKKLMHFGSYNGLSCIDKQFLTDDKIFMDTRHTIESNKVINFSNNNICSGFINFKELTNRLNRLNNR